MAVIFYPPRTGGGGGGAATWGSITGTLSSQTDLQTALNGKSDVGHTHTNLSSLLGFTTSQHTSSPNNLVNASRLLVVAGTADADMVLSPKGTGAFIVDLSDSSTLGGNKRGANAVDLQLTRGNAANVASGEQSSLLGGSSNRATALASSVVGGQSNNASADYSIVLGGSNSTASGGGSAVIGASNGTASGINSVVIGGSSANATGVRSATIGGNSNSNSGERSVILGGISNTMAGDDSVLFGGISNVNDGDECAIIVSDNSEILSTGVAQNSVVLGGADHSLNGTRSIILGGRGVTLGSLADDCICFNAGNVTNTKGVTVNTANTVVFNNADLWLSNNDNTPRSLRFYEQYNTAGAFPNGTNYVALRAPNSIAADVTWTLPNADGTNGQVLQTNGTGTLSWATVSGGNPLSGIFLVSAFASTPNSAVNVSQLLVVAATTNGDLALTPKGSGSILAQLPDNTVTGGNKRGIYSVDLQMVRSSNAQVVSGAYSFTSGRNNTVSGQDSAALGHNNNVRSDRSFCVGTSNTTSNAGNHNYLIGESNVSSTNRVFAWGANNVFTTGTYMAAFGIDNFVDHTYTYVFGNRGKTNNRNTIVLSDSPGTTSRGSSQLSIGLLRATANSASQFPMTDGSAGIVIPVNTAMSVEFTIVGKRRTDSGCCVFRRIMTCFNNGGTSNLIGSVETVGTDFNNGLGGVGVIITVNDATDSINVDVSGRVSETIDFTATAIITQVSSFA